MDYLPPVQAQKTKLKAQKQKSQGRLPDYKAYVIPLRLEERPKGYYLLAEVYFPSTNNTNPYPYWNSYYNPYPSAFLYGSSASMNRYYNTPYQFNSPVRNSDVRMVESVVVEFTPAGKAVRDASMKFKEVRLPALEQTSDFGVHKSDSVLLMYKKEETIFIQREHDVVEEKPEPHEVKIQLKSSDDLLRNEEDFTGELRYWYDRHFYVWGYQTIKNIVQEEDQTRHVFYINSLRLE
ncbi:MAG: hypothetical protein K2U26_06620 [Cyclobacteriaceae bacterium]|nr:hypothetical protein [Cyclobacteriaceae bacterium]